MGKASLIELRKMFPPPWIQQRFMEGEERAALTETGLLAASYILLQQPNCVDESAALRLEDGGDVRGFHRQVARGAEKFVEQLHALGEGGPSPLPGLSVETLIVFMTLLKIQMLHKAGDRDRDGKPVS